MTKAPIGLQELRRRLYRKAKSDETHRFWGMFVHVAKIETLEEAYQIAKRNGGAPGLDGQTFEDIEEEGLSRFLADLREELLTDRYQPQANRRVEIPKDNGKVRILSIPVPVSYYTSSQRALGLIDRASRSDRPRLSIA